RPLLLALHVALLARRAVEERLGLLLVDPPLQLRLLLLLLVLVVAATTATTAPALWRRLAERELMDPLRVEIARPIEEVRAVGGARVGHRILGLRVPGIATHAQVAEPRVEERPQARLSHGGAADRLQQLGARADRIDREEHGAVVVSR